MKGQLAGRDSSCLTVPSPLHRTHFPQLCDWPGLEDKGLPSLFRRLSLCQGAVRPRKGYNPERSHSKALAAPRSSKAWPFLSHGVQHSISTQHWLAVIRAS